jgi:ABC-type bacteriocin/lantibiotic exporter with double-glycine peptidase domain
MPSLARTAPWRKPGGLFLLGFLALSCASMLSFQDLQPTLESQGHYISHVPFIPQEESRCGPAALTMVLNYWGTKVSEKEIAKETYLPALRGVLISDLKAFAERKGFRATSYSSSPDDLRFRISKNEPLILLLDLGRGAYQKPHYILAIGFHEGKSLLIAHSGRNANQVLSFDRVTAQWAKMNYLALLVVPQDHP